MISLLRHGTTWTCTACTEKLGLRASLPGAFAYDAAAIGTMKARAAGVPTRDLLAGAFAASWLVNGATPSPVFRRWLTPPLVEVWTEIGDALSDGTWNDFEPAERDTIAAALGAVMVDGQGVGPVSKALAVLAPGEVPLMPDAALSFGVGAASRVANADAQTAGKEAFRPMMDWFAMQVATAEPALAGIAPVLTRAQVLDRVLWFDSAGYMYFKGWYWVKDGTREGIVKVAAPYEAAARATAIDLASGDVPGPFREQALRALDA